MVKWILSALFLFFTLSVQAQEAWISLKGHLDKDLLDARSTTLDQEVAKGTKTFILVLNSSSGDLLEAFKFAKKLYALKIEKHVVYTVYIENNALGPAAIFPFLADSLYSSLLTSWGDIPLEQGTTIPKNILRNRVVSLILPDNPNGSLLRVLAYAMSDPGMQVVDQQGWKLVQDAQGTSYTPVTLPGETLVVNQNQLLQLGLVKQILPFDAFEALHGVKETAEKNLPIISPLQISPQVFEENLRKYIQINPEGPNQIGLITIDDRTNGINQSTWLYVKNALDFYKKTKPAFIILELNTPGGEVFAAQKISDALKEMDTQFGIPVVAYINNWAISAGAMLAYSCRFITVVKDGSMGAAEPVIASETGQMQTASEKVNSALRADFANRARFFDRNPYIAEAMVDKDIILVLRYGKIVKLDQESQIRTSGSDPDVIISPKGKLLTLNSDELIAYGVADLQLLPHKLAQITDEEQRSGKWPASKMLLFQYPFFSTIPHATVDTYQMDWKTQFLVFLSNPVVSSALFLGLLMGAYMEFSTPGFGLAGSVAAICLFLIILSSFALEIASWLEVILLLAGILIVAIDLFVLPTFGLIGIFGVLIFIIGLLGLMLPGIGSMSFEFDTGTFNAAGEAFMTQLAWLSGTFVLGLGLMALLAKYVTPRFPAFNRFVLKGNEQISAEGYQAGINPKLLPQPGAPGEAATDLRPGGKVLIDNTYYDAISNGSFIEKGTTVKVIGLDGSILIVEEERHT